MNFSVYENLAHNLCYVKCSGEYFKLEAYDPKTTKTLLLEKKRYSTVEMAQVTLDDLADSNGWRFHNFQDEDSVEELLKINKKSSKGASTMSFAKKLARKQQKNSRKKINNELQSLQNAKQSTRRAYIHQCIKEGDIRLGTIHNVAIMFLAAARETFQFGKQRLQRLYERIKRHFACICQGYVTVKEICQILRDEAKMEIHDNRNHKIDRARQIQLKVIDEMSVAFLLSLMDEYGYKGKRLDTVYKKAAAYSERLEAHTMGIQDLEKIIENIIPLQWLRPSMFLAD